MVDKFYTYPPFLYIYLSIKIVPKQYILKIFSSIQNFKSNKKTIVTLGTFDGVHCGHQYILNKIISTAKTLNMESLVLTFFPHPRMVLNKDVTIKLINTIEEKSKLLETTGIDNLIIHPFNKDFSNLSGEEFVKNILVNIFNVHKIYIGYDHRFGKGGSCDINDLESFGKKYGFEVEQISAQEINEVSVSSTKVRQSLNEGKITDANSYLGYKFYITGIVNKGKQLGRTIGFPTANIKPLQDYKLIPLKGVYIVTVEVDHIEYPAMLNIGNNPTVGDNNLTIEANLLNFEGDLYDKEVKVSFYDRIRDEQKFNSLEELKNQLFADKKVTENFFKSFNS